MDPAVKPEKSPEREMGEALCILAIFVLFAFLGAWVMNDVLRPPVENELKARYLLF